MSGPTSGHRGDPAAASEWYRRTFEIVREEDPDGELILLDFNNEIVCPKSDFMFDLVRELRRAGTPIDGIGFQFHINTECNRISWRRGKRRPQHDLSDDRYFASLAENVRRFARAGFDVWITEMSVDVDPARPPNTQLRKQAEIYRRAFETCLEAGIRGIKLWGVLDSRDRRSGQDLRPYLFDEKGDPKPAFFAVRDVLKTAAVTAPPR